MRCIAHEPGGTKNGQRSFQFLFLRLTKPCILNQIRRKSISILILYGVDSANDASNTLIKLDESTKIGIFLQPRIEGP